MTKPDRLTIHRSRFVDFTPANITALSFSHKSNNDKLTPSDLRLAIGKSNGNIEIWNPRNNWFNEMVIQGGKDRSIEGLCWANIPGEPLRLFSIGGSTAVTEWDLATGLPLKNFDCNAGVIWSLAINESQTKLSVGCDNGAIVIIDIVGGKGCLVHDSILVRQDARILALTWNKDDFVIGGCSDGKIKIWCTQEKNKNKGRLINTMKVDKSKKKEPALVWSVLYIPQTNEIVSGDSTGCIKFWDFHYSTLYQSFNSHEADVLCLTTDVTGSHVFSAGIDRKIYQFSRNIKRTNEEGMKWSVTCNRLFHGNDVRAMASYQSKGADLLVSGGIEKSLVIAPLSNFSDGNYQKMPIVVPFMKNVLINRQQRLIVMWQDSLIKIWMIGDDLDSPKNYKLVCKMVLNDDQHITTCCMSPDGQVLLVGRLNTTKIFHLQPLKDKLKVTKLENEILLKTGIKLANFIDNSRVLFCSVDDELFTMDLEAENDEETTEIELEDVPETMSSIKVPFMNKINHMDTFGDYAVVSRRCGAIDLIDLKTNESKTILRIMSYNTALAFNRSRNTIICVTAENKVYELNIPKEKGDSSTLTDWSKTNTENLPGQIKNLGEKCLGVFTGETNDNKIWLWGATWLCRMDLSKDFPVRKRRKTNKHTRDGLTITDESNYINNAADEDEDEEMDIAESLSININDDTKVKTDNTNRAKSDEDIFYFTDKYKPLLFTDLLSDNELVVVERPPIMASGKDAGFALPKFIF
ncbi:hypothetical protein TBLA_0A03210 [Henningerozyma blattae CBS 6284]|uniref:Uncharacterized protein n=1 Tax=Henningerozyma blattae (strain ATCC 34711 / CBS 6284 / DSM 70876 / NBRC 10599 / NRRL Y-10934 / UCD 77-7) TaxID=1071380 RepID=I2GVG9_HENB6|nr:hypothetical protein TBLA_0A03210 [Tetrapisispora blattae CBS 6284]CCH58121.1 hypothetical protein TBLA_0A03210 [Tetrapisispora blattae CBS 6284]